MNLYKVNLNLLVAFDALMQTKHVSKAASLCFISQSAMSNTLSQCRELFQDELLIRTATGMQATPKALSLIGPVREVIDKVQAVFEQTDAFDPKTSTHCFRLGISDYVSATILPKLLHHFHHIAPGIRFKTVPIASASELTALDQDNIELVLGFYLNLPEKYYHQHLYDETAVIVGCQHNPRFKNKFTKKDWNDALHVNTIYQHQDIQSAFDKYLQTLNLPKRNIVVSVPFAFSALQLLRNTDYITVTANKLFEQFAEPFNLQACELPFDMPRLPIYQIWHRQYQQNPPLMWLRNEIKALFTDPD